MLKTLAVAITLSLTASLAHAQPAPGLAGKAPQAAMDDLTQAGPEQQHIARTAHPAGSLAWFLVGTDGRAEAL